MNPTVTTVIISLVGIGCGGVVMWEAIHANNQISSQNVGIMVGLVAINIFGFSCLEK